MNLKSWKDVEKRLKTFYFYDTLKDTSLFKKQQDYCKKYFIVMRLLKRMSDRKVSKLIGIPRSTIYHWPKEQHLPDLLNIAKEIPCQATKEGYRWLPKLMLPRSKPKLFIEVPEKVKTYEDLVCVLEQLGNKDVIILEKRFAYLLGLLLSDVCKQPVSNYSKVCRLRLSKKYLWSIRLGNAFLTTLRFLGFKAWKERDTEPFKDHPNGFCNFVSEASPFFTWVTRTCMGLKEGELTSYDKVKMNWIEKSPKHFKVCFLQGLFDGDGCASIRGWYLANSCNPNQNLIMNMLREFEIKCKATYDGVVITENRSILNAAKLPIFKNATGRLYKMYNLVKMIKNSTRLSKLDIKTLNKIRILAEYGFTPGEISEKLFYQNGYGIRSSSILGFINKSIDSSESG